jgi:hypothetical protein
MADKRTTPDPAARAARRKRAAPTIDLTATEVPAAVTEGTPSAQRPHPAQQQSGAPRDAELKSKPESKPAPKFESKPEPKVESKPEPKAGREAPPGQSAWLSAPAVVGGFFGAAAAALVLAALWFAGAVPVRNPVPADSSAQVDALAQRITRMEGALAKIPANDPSVSERLSAADNAMKSLGIALTALSKHSEEAATGAADARARADAAEKAVTQLRSSVQDLSKNASAGLSPADVDIVQKRLAALEQATKSGPVDTAARLALSTAALRDAVTSGAPFTAELDEARSLGADEKALKLVAPFAANGLPTAAALGKELGTLIPAMLKASGGQAPAGSFLERIEANASKLVRIRPVGAPAGDDTSAVLARTEVEAAQADIDGALADLAKLDPTTRAPAQSWIEKARARQAALVAARQLAGDTAHSLGKR